MCYLRNHATGPDAITHSHAHVISILAPPHKELVSHKVRTVINHKATTLHSAGVAAAEVGRHVNAVTAALIGATLEVPVLVEDNLPRKVCIFKYKLMDSL